ncbi:MAG: tRNA (adenosine(37)-N6)-threonylcarbamoyltransferase complex transferase subunit TsaD, partial [Endomicrobia bacterium]|nr:tRNA (adenosine(37)-N6)-threonylcarbamoyltransferase complex transferase subunit TsaD [Endomicrobiia bacterium]
MKKYVLGLETSCDETASAVVSSEFEIISNIVFSQQKIHASFFGVVPELASRTHYEKIHFVLDKALKKFDIKNIDLIAYTEKPGLKGALLIGKTVAKTLGYIYSKP